MKSVTGGTRCHEVSPSFPSILIRSSGFIRVAERAGRSRGAPSCAKNSAARPNDNKNNFHFLHEHKGHRVAKNSIRLRAKTGRPVDTSTLTRREAPGEGRRPAS